MIPQIRQLTALRSLLRHPRVARDEVVAFQSERLRRLIAHAYDRIPYYRRLFERNGIKPRDIRTAADLAAIPTTSKRDLQALPTEDVVARGFDPSRLIFRRTSGSSGEPFIIRRTWFEERLLTAFQIRALHYFGLQVTDKRAHISLIRPNQDPDNQLLLRIVQAVGLYRMMKIDCLLAPEEILCELRRFRPDVFTGFAGVLSRLAQSVGDGDRLIIRPRFVVTGAEVLTPLMRRQISEAFRAQVFDTFGAHEFKLIAWQCKETGEFHTCDDSLIIEVLRDGRPAAAGERGEMVGTNLHSFAMPFIRYRLGDIVTKGSETCSCGQPFSTIKAIQGRMIDYFLLPNGRIIHPYEIVLILVNEAPWMRQYRLIQEREDRILLQAVPFATPSSEKLMLLKDQVTRLLRRDVDFQIALVSEIPLESSGKFRVSRSLVNSCYDGIDWDQL
jgi:phenylacetate-CoA ligase